MTPAPIPENEDQRLHAVHGLNILNTSTEERFDVLTKGITEQLGVPISTVSILDKDREWFKSCVGLDEKEGPRDASFCGHALVASEMFIVEDTLLDPMFKDNPHVIGPPFIRFYAGMKLHDAKTYMPVGVFCIKDTKPRTMTMEDMDALMQYAKKAEEEINKTA